MTAEFVIGPYFCEDIVTAAAYQETLNSFFSGVEITGEYSWSVLQQDGAPAHTANKTLALLRCAFTNLIISKKCDVSWPPAPLPDLVLPVLCLLRLNVKRRKSSSIPELKRLHSRRNLRAESQPKPGVGSL